MQNLNWLPSTFGLIAEHLYFKKLGPFKKFTFFQTQTLVEALAPRLLS